MNKQPEALRLAAELTTPYTEVNREAANELRRLHEVNVELLALFKEFQVASKAPDYSFDGQSWLDRMDVVVNKATGETE